MKIPYQNGCIRLFTPSTTDIGSAIIASIIDY